MRNLTLALLGFALVSSLTGCQKVRQLTRRDYKEMDDPFSESQDAAIAEARRVREQFGAQPSSTSATPASFSSQEKTTELSKNFAGVRASSMGNVISKDEGPKLSDFVRNAENGVTNVNNNVMNGLNNGTKTAEAGMNGMSDFLKQQATASGLTETAQQLDGDFTSWAAEQKQNWNQQTANAVQKASPFTNATRSVSAGAQTPPMPTRTATLTRELSTRPTNEVATPFIRQTGQLRTLQQPERATPAGFSQPGGVPQFPAQPTGGQPASGSTGGNPFEEFMRDRTGASVQPTQRPGVAEIPVVASSIPEPSWSPRTAGNVTIADANPTASLDSEFTFDTGWRPPSFGQ